MPHISSKRLFAETDLPVDAIRASRSRRSELGQFFTPATIADFMASLFETVPPEVRLLDAGAGEGALSAAFVRRCCRQSAKPESVAITASEFDRLAIAGLHETMERCRADCAEAGIEFSAEVRCEDFIASASESNRRLCSEVIQNEMLQVG